MFEGISVMRLHKVALILAVVVVFGMPYGAMAQRAASVLVEKAEVRAIADTAPIIGQLVPSTQADVAARRSGIAAVVMFEIGDTVKAGAPLVELETTLTEIEQRTVTADLAVARAGIEAAEARVARAQQALRRQERLRGSNAFSKGSFDDLTQSAREARGQLAEAIAQVGAAEARLARIDYDLTNAMIRAPFTGVVVERMAQPGQYVNLGQAVAKLLEVEGLEVEGNVPVELIQGLAPGTEVSLRLSDGASATARVRVVLPVETVSTRTRPVRFTVDLTDLDPLLLAVGKSVTLQVPVSAPRDILTVPKDALVQGRGGGWMVFVVAEGKAQPKPLTLGQAAGDRMEVLSGLTEGDQVVVRGNERLRPGQPVKPTLVGN